MLENWSLLNIFLYSLGLILLLVEAMMPGFGIAGISGVVCVIISIIMVSKSTIEALLLILATLVMLIIVVLVMYKYGFGKGHIKSMILKTEQKNSDGYKGTVDFSKYIGMRGIVTTTLRSAGTVMINQDKLDAVSEGEFIEKGSEVEIIKVEGNRIVARKI